MKMIRLTLLTVMVGMVGMVGLVGSAWAATPSWQDWVSKTWQEVAAPVGTSGKVVLCFASEKKAMGDYVPAEVTKLFPKLKVELYFDGSGELMQELKEGNKRGCDLVSPASRVLALGASGYTPSAKSIGATPLVLVMKEDATLEIEKILGHKINYSDIVSFAGQVWKNYAPAANKRGIIKVGITQAKFSNSGAVAAVSFVHNRLNKYEPLVATDVDEASADLKKFWAQTSHTYTSTGDLSNEFASDASTLTGIVTYESELPKIITAMANKGGVRVVYPDPGIMNDHPTWIVENSQNREGAEAVLSYLLSVNGQNQMAKKVFLRPVNPKAKLEFPADVQKLVIWDVGPVDVPADARVVNTLMEYVR
ncbi:putative Extracellular solute-binding protein [Gammaproteobacteria bacterium]